YGLQSRDALELSGELEIRLGRRLSPTLLYDCPTIESLASHVARETTAAQSDVPPAPRVTAASLEPIAIVGIGCRFPGAAGPAAFWQLLVDGVDAVREVPSDRWDAAAADGMLAGRGSGNGRATVRWGGWLADIDRFDSEFFGISPREAACIDPQQRLLLEVAWEALEDAGLPAERLRGSAGGVFVGISTNDYRQAFAARTSEVDPYWSTGNAGSIAANRLSYFFDLRGPSIAIDTACSSSLVAVHLAAGSLRNGECDVALAGGVNAILTPDISFSFAKGGGLAPDGRCKAFDSRADGIVRSEGVGIVVLKRLSDAMADGDSIYAVIRGSAVNQDGRSNGITAPNQAAQEAVLRSAWRSAGISPTEAQTIETHGAGTLLGDVIEANALMAVLAPGRTPDCPCAIGSVKTNIGHCEAAAGAAGLIKLALAIRHGRIPRSLHFKEPNPHIPFCEAPLAVQTETVDWPGPRDRRLAGVSSFGFGGTNAHVVLESPPPARVEPVPAMSGADAVHLLPLSAANMDALQALARRLDERLAAGPAELVDLCCEAATRRTHLDHRAALRFCSIETLREQLRAVGTGQGHPAVRVGRKPGDRRLRFAYVFSGHGGQWRGMHRPLWERFPAFRARLEECDRLVRQQAGWSVLTELDADPARSGMERGSVEVVQTTLLAMQLAMVEAWKSWGIEPDAVAGHSMGEIAAACAAGALDVGDAVRVVVARSRALEEALSGIGDCGGMAALRISGDEAEELIQDARDRVWISVHNSPNYTVLSGDRAILEELVAGLRHRKIGARMMDVPGAAHTPLLEPAAGRLRAALEGLTCRAEVVPFYSTLTGARRDGRELNAAYWADSICRPVRFAATIRALVQSGCRGFLEIGPHPMLTAAVAQCMEPLGVEAMVGPSLRRGDRDLDAMLGSFGALYAAGVDVDWQRIYPGQGRWASLPAYPWQRQRCWIDALPARAPGPPSAMAPADGNGRGAEPGAPERPIGPSPRPAPHGLECVVPASASARQVLEETEPGKRQKGLEAYLQAQIAYTLNTDPARIDVERSLTTMGIDSLMGIEIKNRVEAELGVAVSLVQFLEGPTIARLADAVLPQLDRHASSTELAKDQAASGTNGGEIADEEAARLLERLEQLSDEEVDALTQRMLAE
ncbi:MAG: acyltransferase domain-containing protein, partial [Pirellulales bacterium]|nr:acyltransferase domain-containing protein [Pirellulales bacterium]